MIYSVSICGPSGIGKATLINQLQILEPNLFVIPASGTTRELKKEAHGKKYTRFTFEEFEHHVATGDIIEFNKFKSDNERGFNYYGTLRSSFEEIIAMGKVPVLDIDLNGLVKMRSRYGSTLLSIGLDAEPEEIEDRLRKRGTESGKELQERLATGLEELKRIKLLQMQGTIDEVVWYGKGAIPGIKANEILNLFVKKKALV